MVIIKNAKMTFLNLISNDICHPENVHLQPGPTLFCNQCQNSFNVYELITKPSTDHFRSSQLAEAFFEWTGDENVPMNFTLVDLEGLFPVCVVGQSLNRVKKGLRLLKALNGPFMTRSEINHFPDMDTFLIDFLNIVNEHSNEESSQARAILDVLIKGMHDLLSCKEIINPFETYFNDLVPYVKKCLSQWEPVHLSEEYPNLAHELLVHLQLSSAIRQSFGKYSIPFDIIHVMVSSYICSADMSVVGNWVLDFMARVCRGQFFWKAYPDCPFVAKMNRVIQQNIDHRKHAAYAQTLKAIRLGDAIEYYSEYLRPFHQVQMYLKSQFCSKNDSVAEMAFNQIFPAVCFQDHGDCLGFMVGSSYLMQIMKRSNGNPPKGSCKKAKQLHAKIQKFVGKIQKFDSGPFLFWTLDTFQLFLMSDSSYEQEIQDLFGIVLDINQDGN